MSDDKINPGISRRNFIKTSSAAAAGLVVSANSLGFAQADSEKKRYAIVGVGSRSRMYRNAILGDYASYAELVGFCDVNMGRLKLAQDDALKKGGDTIPVYDAKEFDRMVSETKPDIIVVTTVDGFHHKYIIRGMELGCDIITEKPMTIDSKKWLLSGWASWKTI